MDCPTCHQLNTDDAVNCSLCGTLLARRAPAGGEMAVDQPMIGLSYGATAPDTMGLKIHSQKAAIFIASALLMQMALVVSTINGKWVMEYFGMSHLIETVSTRTITLALAGYALFVFAWCAAKTSQAIGRGFWITFGLALLPPCVPGALARMGNRSVLWTYVYLSLDALAIAMALKFFSAAPAIGLLVLIVATPLTAYHLSGCAIGSIGQSIGLNPYFATIWLLAGPLAYILFALMRTGLAADFVNSMVGDSAAPTAESLTRLLNFGMVTREYAAYATAVAWGAGGWILWLKSVYESLKFPLI